nr:hypothetical protein Iba_chr11aCG12290 [Ipomoea batatas]
MAPSVGIDRKAVFLNHQNGAFRRHQFRIFFGYNDEEWSRWVKNLLSESQISVPKLDSHAWLIILSHRSHHHFHFQASSFTIFAL